MKPTENCLLQEDYNAIYLVICEKKTFCLTIQSYSRQLNMLTNLIITVDGLTINIAMSLIETTITENIQINIAMSLIETTITENIQITSFQFGQMKTYT